MSDFKKTQWSDTAFSEQYLDRADIYIPLREEMFRLALEAFEHFCPNPTNALVVDLGSGDGAMLSSWVRKYPDLRAVLVDASHIMLQKASVRFRAHPNCSFVRAEFQSVIERGLPDVKHPDCVVSAQALHHLDHEEKKAMFARIYKELKPGGFFIDLDVVLPPTPEVEKMYLKIWERRMDNLFQKRSIYDENGADIVQRYKGPDSGNRPGRLGSQLRMLKDAGFSHVDCLYKNGIFAVFFGLKTD